MSVTAPSSAAGPVGPAEGVDGIAHTEAVGSVEHRVGHIVEDPAGIARLIDVEVPTEYYYEKFRENLESRHPHASKEIIEHMDSLVVFLDTSILFGFSFGSAKASIAVTTAKISWTHCVSKGCHLRAGACECYRGFCTFRES